MVEIASFSINYLALLAKLLSVLLKSQERSLSISHVRNMRSCGWNSKTTALRLVREHREIQRKLLIQKTKSIKGRLWRGSLTTLSFCTTCVARKRFRIFDLIRAERAAGSSYSRIESCAIDGPLSAAAIDIQAS